MNISPQAWRSTGRGRGQNVYQSLDFWEDRPGRNPGPSHVRRDPVSNNFKLHIRSIPYNWNVTILKNVFSKCGQPQNVYIHPSRGPNTLTWGSVEYEHYQEAFNAVRELNNNVMLNIQVMFAREKPSESEFDPILKFLASGSEEDMGTQLVDPRKLVKMVKNENVLNTDMPIEDFHKPVLDQDTQRCIEEALFQKILDIYKEGEGFTGKCNLCEASSSTACSGCTVVFYCSENCQNKDWTSHSQTCKGASRGAAEETQSRAGGDYRQGRSEFTNGYGSFNSERENRSDNRSFNSERENRSDNRSFNSERENRSDNRTNRFGADRRSNNFDSGFNRDRGQRAEQNGNDQQGRRSLFEERKAKMVSSNRQNESEKGFQSRFGQNNQRSQYGQESKSTFKPRTNDEADEDWDSENKEIEVKKEVQEKLKTSGETVEETKEVNVPTPVVETKVAEVQLQPGLVFEVLILCVDDRGLFWVQKPDEKYKIAPLLKSLEEHFGTSNSQFSPVQEGLCGVQYEGKWYRCKITSLEPLTVHYIDFGYPEAVEASRLFELSSDLKSLPPLAFKVKLVDGSSESFLDKVEGDSLNVKLIEKTDHHWLVQVVGDTLTLPEVPEAVTTNGALEPSTISAPAPSVEVSVETTQVDQAVVADKTKAETPSLQQPSMEQQTSPQPSAQQPFPHMFSADSFTTVVITYPVDSEPKDSYYVGASTIWAALSEMFQHFKSVVEHCEVLTPKHGLKGLAMFMDEWYRVSVVSVTPLLVYYIDFGNVEPLEPEGLRKCPETHKDVPNLVHKIKLAPGTNPKYFNLPELSQLSVKPVSWLADSTIVVEVEGENHTEVPPTPVQVSEDSSSTAKAVERSPVSSSSPATSNVPLQTSSATSDPTGSAESTSEKPAAVLGPSPIQVELKPSRSPSAVDLLQEKWKISFVPNKVDLVKNSLLGQIYCEKIPSTISFVMDNDKFQNHLSTQKFDPDFKPNVGEVVGLLHPLGEFERGRVLPPQGLVAFNDLGGVTRSSQLFKLLESFVNIPSMAAVFTLRNEDPDLLIRLGDKDEIIFDVVKVVNNKGNTVVHVINNTLQDVFEGELKTWDYEPLETPDPLTPGDSVTISRVIDSNTLLVAPANDLELQQKIQIDCRKMSEGFKTPPKEGEYVAFLDKESDGYFRCRVDKVDGDAYTIYAVDNATYHQAKLEDLRPLPSSLRNVPCRISQIELKDVDKVLQTEQAQIYLCHIVEEDKSLTIDTDDSGKVTLTVEGEEDTLNNKLKELLIPKIVPDSEGKLTILSLPELRVPLNQDFKVCITQTDPLYVQLEAQALEYLKELHTDIQVHCEKDNAPYNPCESELVFGLFGGEWYRCRCLKETNTGVSVLMLVDFGNIFSAQTSGIRRILPEMLVRPSYAIPCRIHGLPEPVSPALKAQIDKILEVDSVHPVVFIAENDGSYEVVIESVKQAIQNLQ